MLVPNLPGWAPAWRRLTVVPVAAWLLALALGFAALTRYAGIPGRPASPPPRWPEGSSVARAPGRLTLVMLIHPHCACTRASLRELERLVARAGDAVSAHVVVAGHDDGDDRLARMAAAIAVVHRDPEGEDARRFGAFTSGEVVVYDAAGDLFFHGGITPARGHEGGSDGAVAILSRARGEAITAGTAPVFGCAIRAGEAP